MAEATLRNGKEKTDDEIASVNTRNSAILASNNHPKVKPRKVSRSKKDDIENLDNRMNV